MAITLDLKVLLLNAENLFLLSDNKLTEAHLSLDEVQWQRLSTSVFQNKPLAKLRRLAAMIEELKPDLILLEEVGGHESLNYFSSLFLKSAYSAALLEGNSNRNIDVGFLIKRQMPFYFDLVSNKNRPLNFNYPHEQGSELASHKFSRDVAELHLFNKDRDKPFLILLLTHLKSRLDPDGIDPNGTSRRQAELKTLVEIYQSLENKFSGRVPIVIAGDFNGNASSHSTDPEFLPIYQNTAWKDVCELAGLSESERATYYQISRNNRSEGRQIDFAFLSGSCQPLLDRKSVQVYRYKDDNGFPFEPPATLEAKALLPSDHYPLIFTLSQIPMID